jgi:Tfp pilus assembly protein PilP
MKHALLMVLCICASALPAAAQGQDRLPPGTRVGTATVSSGYDDGGRRDPFVSLMAPKKTVAPQNTARPRTGLGSLSLADVSVKGIVRTGGAVVAVLESPDGKSFVAHSKDRLQDATVKSIDADGVVFAEQVVDAGGAVRYRDVRKTLRPIMTEGAR